MAAAAGDLPPPALTAAAARAASLAPPPSVVRAGANGTAVISVAGSFHTLFLTLQVGTPAVAISAQLDTGSPTLWLSSALCKAGSGCRDKSKVSAWDPTKSRSVADPAAALAKPIQRRYGDGSTIECVVVEDAVRVAGATIERQPVCAATLMDFPSSPGEMGIIGLGPPQTQDPASLFDRLRTSFVESKVSFYFDRSVGTFDSSLGLVPNAGEVTIGTPNTARYKDDFLWVPILKNSSNWSVKLDSITIGQTRLTLGVETLLDTGTSLIFLDSATFDYVNADMGGKVVNGLYQLNCTKLKSLSPITFVLKGVSFTLTWDKQFFVLGGKYCVSIFTKQTNGGPTILGASFLRQFYTSFDYAASLIGLAQLVDNAPDQTIPGISKMDRSHAGPRARAHALPRAASLALAAAAAVVLLV
nr:hypothetical protein HK105_006493 [Polyrhizophydium stewartii]